MYFLSTWYINDFVDCFSISKVIFFHISNCFIPIIFVTIHLFGTFLSIHSLSFVSQIFLIFFDIIESAIRDILCIYLFLILNNILGT